MALYNTAGSVATYAGAQGEEHSLHAVGGRLSLRPQP
jgi:hypothetical protein